MKSLFKLQALLIISILLFPVLCHGQDDESSTSSYSGFFFSAGIGRGALNARFTGVTVDEFSNDGLGFSYRFGYAVNNMIHLGFDMDLFLYYRHSKFKTSEGYCFVLNYYINDILFIKGGPSLTLIEGEPTGSEESISAAGFNLGAGLDIRIFDRLAFTPVYSYYHASASNAKFNYHIIALGFSYYFR